MAFLLVKDGIVVNIFPEAPPEDWSLPGHIVVEADAQIGWELRDGAWAPPLPPVPPAISRRQCAKRMAQMGIITPAEALAMTRYGEPPAFVAAMIAGQPNADLILMDFAADTYERANPLLNQMMSAAGYDAASIDQFFREASQV